MVSFQSKSTQQELQAKSFGLKLADWYLLLPLDEKEITVFKTKIFT